MAVAAVPEITTEVREVGLDEAARLLSANGHNRNLRPYRVTEFAGAMKRGEWQFNGDAIRVADDGTLLDGQHRLAAISESGCPQTFVVIEGLPHATQETMDQGLKRSVSDVLALRGEKSVTQLAAAARVVFVYDARGTFREGMLKPTSAQVIAHLEAHPSIRDAVRHTDPIRKNTYAASSIAAACWHLFSRVDLTETDVFFTRFAMGAELAPTDPIFALRRQFTQKRPVGNKIAPYVQGALIIKGWNAWRRGDEVRHLIWRPGGATPEPFPRPDGLDDPS